MFFSGSDFHGWRGLLDRSAQEAVAEGLAGAEESRDIALERLDELWSLANGATCRHRRLVEYFGQEWASESCNACDVCLQELKQVEGAGVLAQKILSCVVRCDQRYGAAHVSDVLRGAKTAKLRETHHDQLSTYGLLPDCTSREIRSWIDQLVALGHLAVTEGNYPTLYLTASGLEVMKGERELTLLIPETPARKRKRSSALAALDEGAPPPDEGLFEVLRQLRRSMARERGVPPYILFSDRTLALMAGYKPTSRDEFLQLKGVGERKAEDLGPHFLAAIAEYGPASETGSKA